MSTTSSPRKRLIAGVGASALGPLITALVQVVSVPAFLRVWGPHLYGEWLVMSALPAYLSLTDMGFGSVAGNDMSMRVAAGDHRGAIETFQSTSLLLALLSVTAALLIATVLTIVPIGSILHITEISPLETRLTLAVLSVYALSILQASILMSAFRSDGFYALGVAGLNVTRILENVAIWVALFTTHRPLYVAIAGTSLRIVGTGVLYLLLRHSLAWLPLGFSHASGRRIRELAKPAFAFMAFPAGNGISIQGMTVLIGLTLGPVAVATFNPMRTLSRFAYQILDSIKNTMWPELSAAYGAQNWDLARKLHRTCCQVAFWLAILAVGGLAVAGPTIFRLWTRNRVAINLPCFYLLLAVVVASSLWNTSSAVPIAANRHEGLALRYVVGTSASLGLAYLLLPQLGLQGAAIALLASDIWMGCFVIRGSNSLLKDNTKDFLRSMIQVDRLRLLWAR